MNGIPRLSIRARITIGSLVIAAVLFSTAAFFFRLEVQSILAETTATLLRNDAAPVIAALVADPREPIDGPGEGQLIATVDPQGEVHQSTLPRSLEQRMPELASMSEDPQAVAAGPSSYLVAATSVPTVDGSWVVVAARNQEALGLLLDQLTQVLIIGTLVLVLGFGIASWLLTGAALRPVSRLREEAESLTEAGSSDRLPVPAGKDEVSELAVTLNDLIARLRGSVDREKQVVSDASHELRTPLAVLKTQLDLAHLNSGDADALEKDIDDASSTVDRLSRLATNLLELSKLESEQAVPEIEWSVLAAEVTASVDRARVARGSRNVEVVYEISGDDPDGYYRLSRTNAGQLVDNLVSNALSMIEGSGTVTVGLERDGNEAILTVIDTGPGMPEEYIPIAFDRFSRPDRSRADGSAGSGLGLAIVHTIVERSGGTISLRNTGTGLAVEVRLPCLSRRT
ncbi:MAG: two-component system sensor protein [Cryobacterium sp.]|jgi:signal transduction histidine kinase|nr:two-component system sensor protein [Cryobacterium sp.]